MEASSPSLLSASVELKKTPKTPLLSPRQSAASPVSTPAPPGPAHRHPSPTFVVPTNPLRHFHIPSASLPFPEAAPASPRPAIKPRPAIRLARTSVPQSRQGEPMPLRRARTSRLYVLFALLLLSLSPTPLTAQTTTTGAISGHIVDPLGRPISPAVITVTDLAHIRSFTLASDPVGDFLAPSLPPSEYTLDIRSSGFGPLHLVSILVELGATARIQAALVPSSVQTSVTVTSDLSSDLDLDAPPAATSTVISSPEISRLPIDGRRWQTFALLTPQANPGSNSDAEAGGLLSFSGLAPTRTPPASTAPTTTRASTRHLTAAAPTQVPRPKTNRSLKLNPRRAAPAAASPQALGEAAAQVPRTPSRRPPSANSMSPGKTTPPSTDTLPAGSSPPSRSPAPEPSTAPPSSSSARAPGPPPTPSPSPPATPAAQSPAPLSNPTITATSSAAPLAVPSFPNVFPAASSTSTPSTPSAAASPPSPRPRTPPSTTSAPASEPCSATAVSPQQRSTPP